MITVTGVQLYRWYKMGIVDYEDLQWLLQFYHNIRFPLGHIGNSVMCGRRYFDE